jgi:hypothetical protein
MRSGWGTCSWYELKGFRSQIRGIGKWTADVWLCRSLGEWLVCLWGDEQHSAICTVVTQTKLNVDLGGRGAW